MGNFASQRVELYMFVVLYDIASYSHKSNVPNTNIEAGILSATCIQMQLFPLGWLVHFQTSFDSGRKFILIIDVVEQRDWKRCQKHINFEFHKGINGT